MPSIASKPIPIANPAIQPKPMGRFKTMSVIVSVTESNV